MKIAINNQQNLLKINKRGVSRLVSFLMQKAAGLMPDRQWGEISLVITDHALMTSLNEQFSGNKCTTDVLSFCLPPMTDTQQEYSGEIFVNAEIALDRKGASYARELALYIAHGCDHLMDEDDSDAPSRKRMRNRELRWLRKADTMGLLNTLAKPSGKAPADE